MSQYPQADISKSQKRHSHHGFSLIEVAIILLFISLAMIPIVNSISGPGGSYGTGDAKRSGSGTRVIGSKHKEVTLANALMERLLSGDTSILNTPLNNAGSCTGGSIPSINSGQTKTFNCINNQYGENIYYQWIVTDRSREFAGNQVNDTNTMGNDFFQVTLNMYNNPTWDQGGIPIMTMPTVAFRNTQSPTQPSNVTGIVMVLDTSGSMDEGGPGVGNTHTVLPYRYSDTGYTPSGMPALNLFKNSELDIVGVADVDDPLTSYIDTYPLKSVLGITANCGKSNDKVFGSYASSQWQNVCKRLTSPGFEVDENLSRLEAARSSLLKFLLTIEEDPTLRNNIQLGFVSYDSGTTYQVPKASSGTLESPDSNGQYVNMRKRLSWLNREDGKSGTSSLEYTSGSTGTWDGVDKGAQLLLNQPNLNGRVLFLVTDGVPTWGNCSGSTNPSISQTKTTGECMRDKKFGSVKGLGTSLGDGSYPGANGKTVNIFGLGLMEDQQKIRNVIEEGFTKPTHGDFQYTESIGEMNSVFENMKYSILKEIIKSNAGRYGIEYD